MGLHYDITPQPDFKISVFIFLGTKTSIGLAIGIGIAISIALLMVPIAVYIWKRNRKIAGKLSLTLYAVFNIESSSSQASIYLISLEAR